MVTSENFALRTWNSPKNDVTGTYQNHTKYVSELQHKLCKISVNALEIVSGLVWSV